jgi:predicted transcriptional regulator
LKRPYAKPTLTRTDSTEHAPGSFGAGYARPGLQSTPTETHPSRKKNFMERLNDPDPIISIAGEVVCAYVSRNPLPATDLPDFIHKVYASLKTVSGGAAPLDEPKAAVPVRRSVTPDFIICLEDGRRFKSLRRHIETHYGLTPDQYRRKWGLPPDYPMVAPNYSATRSQLAKSMGLGQRPK